MPAPGAQAPDGSHVATGARGWILGGIAVVALTFGGIGGWGATMPLASAVVTAGQVTVDTNRKQVQHLEGGIVAELRVRDGDAVEQGDVVIRLDDTRARASLAIVGAAWHEELAREARLVAERDGFEAIIWPQDLHDKAYLDLLAGQQVIFSARRETLEGETAIFEERIRALEQQIAGLDAQKAASERQIALVSDEIEPLQELFERGHVTKQRLLALRREAARLDGEHGELVSDIARARKTIGETRLEIIQKRKAFRNEVVETLGEVQAQIKDLRERYIAAVDVLERIDIRAPVAGRVVGLAVHGENAVIGPGETILEIVPSGDRLLIEVRVAPQDIDNVAVGQSSEVRLLAFRQRSTPTLEGTVSYVSADALSDAQSGTTFYLARVEVSDDQLARLNGQTLQPGMPAEVMIRTGERTAIAYLVQPILDSMNRAWREE